MSRGALRRIVTEKSIPQKPGRARILRRAGELSTISDRTAESVSARRLASSPRRFAAVSKRRRNRRSLVPDVVVRTRAQRRPLTTGGNLCSNRGLFCGTLAPRRRPECLWTRGEFHETYLSTFQDAPSAHSWFPGADAHQGRPRGDQRAPRQGAQAPVGLIGAPPRGQRVRSGRLVRRPGTGS